MKKIQYILFITLLITGCGERGFFWKTDSDKSDQSYWQRYGIVYYLDGAGNLGFGTQTVPKALKAQGFRGAVENITWTSYTGPLGDQMIRANAKFRAEQLTETITNYREKYPKAPVYIIGLSAGSGVAVWAIENLSAQVQINAVILLGSSLSNNYDMTKTLSHIKDKVYVFSSPKDQILKTFMPVTGTIDGQYGTEPAGITGLIPPKNASAKTLSLYRDKVSNIPWKPVFSRLGNKGGHTDGTSFKFLKYYVFPKVLGNDHDKKHKHNK